MVRLLGVVLLGFLLTGCGYDGHFRYPCQDPANWENEDCKPPICTINGACPEDLVNIEDMTNQAEETVVEE